MFKQKKENEIEAKDKNEGFVNEKGESLSGETAKQKEEPNPNDVDLSIKNIEYKDDHFKNIEKARGVFLKIVKKQNIIKWIVSLIAIGLLVFAFIYVLGKLNIKWLGIVLSVVSIIIIIAYYFIVKKYNDKKMKGYLKVYYGDINAFVFGDSRFSNVNGDIEGKIDNAEFNKSLLYKDVSTIGSRNIVNFKIDNKYDCKICDCAAQQTTVKKLVPLFIGKYLTATCKYNSEDPIFIYLTGNNRALPPNNLDNIPKVVNTKKMIIYSHNKNYEKIINAKVRQLISEIVTNNILVDLSIAIHKGFVSIAFGYDDCLMVLPLQDKFNPIPTERFKKDMLIVADIIKNLN